MNCKNFQDLTIIEKTELIGKVVHVIQNDEKFFGLAKLMIADAEKEGLFKDVKILPESTPEDH
jgi:hypothetical protein